MMIATAVFMIFMATAFTAVVEAQRGINTVVARNNDEDQVQSYLNSLTSQVRQATAIATYGGTGPYSQLWIYNSNPPTTWPYKCTIWVYNSSTSPTEVEAFVSNGTVSVSSPTPTTIAAVSGVATTVQLSGVSPVSSTRRSRRIAATPGLSTSTCRCRAAPGRRRVLCNSAAQRLSSRSRRTTSIYRVRLGLPRCPRRTRVVPATEG